MDERKMRKDIVELGKQLLERELVARTWGNISGRLDRSECLITPSGLDYKRMEEADIVRLDISTGQWEGNREPSSEKLIHMAAYSRFEDVRFVVHTHQKYATALGMTGLKSVDINEREWERLAGVGIAAYGPSGSEELRDAVDDVLRSGMETVLMIHHGALVCGRTREQAMERVLLLEQVCGRSVKGMEGAGDYGIVSISGELADELRAGFSKADVFRTPAVDICAAKGDDIYAQVDDMAQMIGERIPVVGNTNEAVSSFKRWPAVLIKDVGAVVRAKTEDDVEALRLLVDKACICCVHTRAMDMELKLAESDVIRMRHKYEDDYARRKDEM